jgi:predicted unusual protein kinase regulating ubiquinone biosynthesis (AarF/ABC1/UbiB family)
VALSLKPEHLKRYKDVALLLFKYGRRDMVARAGLAELLPPEAQKGDQAEAAPSGLAHDVEQLGTTFIKLGQLLSTRADIVPQAYADALERLQDHCEPFPFSEVEAILSEELGVRLSKPFEFIEPKPVAAASISQVHYARLRDGREVALKVQRPGLREEVLSDLEALGGLAAFLDDHTDFGQRFGIALVYEEFRKSLLRELDFRQEALHLVTIGNNLQDIPEIVIPRPLLPYSTSRVLTMEFISGIKVTSLSPLARMELDGERLADALFRAYLKQILSDGIFHADPHPGNVFIVDSKIALIDLGMVARIPPAMQDRLLQLLLAVSDNKPDDATKLLLMMAERREDADEPAFQRDVTDILGQQQEVTLTQPQVGRVMLMLLAAGATRGFRLPPELMIVGKTLLNLDEIGRTLAPDFDPNAATRRHAGEIVQHKMSGDLSISSLFSAAVDMKNFVQQLPGRVNRILDRLAENELRVRVDAIDEAKLMEGMQKVANRITVGLVLAALIIGAALLMRVETSFQLFGYPGLAILLFIAAAAGGLMLVTSILMNDIKAGRKARIRQ